MKKFTILLLALMFTVSILFVGISCKTTTTETTAEATTAETTPAAETTAAETTAKEAEPGKILLEVASHWWMEPLRGNVWRQVCVDFMKENPNVVISEVGVPYARYQDTFLTRLAAGEAPDIMTLGVPMLPVFQSLGYLSVLDDLVNISELEKDFNETKNNGIVDGKYYALFLEPSQYGLIYNKELFEQAGISEPPKTPEDFLEAAKLLTNEEKQQFGYAMRHMVVDQSGGWYELSAWVFNFGGRWAIDGKPTVNTPEVIEAIEFVKKLYDEGVMPKATDAATYRKMCWEGKVAMLTDNVSTLSGLIIGSGRDDLFLTTTFPYKNIDQPVTFATGVMFSIPSAAENKETAAKFLEYIFRPDVLRTYANTVKNGVNSVTINEEIIEAYPYLKSFLLTKLNPDFSLIPPGLGNYFNEFSNAVFEQLEEVLVNNKSATDAMNDAQSNIEDAIKE